MINFIGTSMGLGMTESEIEMRLARGGIEGICMQTKFKIKMSLSLEYSGCVQCWTVCVGSCSAAGGLFTGGRGTLTAG